MKNCNSFSHNIEITCVLLSETTKQSVNKHSYDVSGMLASVLPQKNKNKKFKF